MENLTSSAVAVVVPSSSGPVNVQPIASVSGVSNVADVNLSNIATVSNIPQVVGTTNIPTISQVWYNCGPDGVPHLVAANPQSAVEINSDLARQFNQQVQTPYGNIQVQVQPVSAATTISTVLKSEEPLIGEDPPELHIPNKPKPATATRVRSANERVSCPTCGKTVSCNATLRDHMRTHTGDRPFVCTECNFAFAQRSNLRMHKRLHTGERPYMCGICGKTFARSSHLPAHMRTHTGEKPYVCERCDHAFITSQQLKNHFRVHTGEKPWVCDLCPAAFTHSSSLSTHKKKHTGSKPYMCDICQKCFFFTSALDKHKKVHSKVKPYKCTECDKAFKYKESLTVHMDKYCGKEILKKPKAPRRPGSRKPGPKPSVNKKPGKARGRPRTRKKARWSTRVKTRRNYHDMANMIDYDPIAIEEDDRKDGELILQNEEQTTFVKGNENSNEDYKEDSEDNEEENTSNKPGTPESAIPTAELKVEVINPEETNEILVASAGSQQVAAANDFTNEPTHIAGDIIQMQSANEIHIDENTALTIVSAEEAEQQVAQGGMQLVTLTPGMPLQFVQDNEGQITHQLITRDGIQMWYPRQ